MVKKGENAQMSNFTFFHPLLATFQLSSAASLNFGKVSKWCIREYFEEGKIYRNFLNQKSRYM